MLSMYRASRNDVYITTTTEMNNVQEKSLIVFSLNVIEEG